MTLGTLARASALDWIEQRNEVAGAVLAIAALAHYALDDRVGEPQWVDEHSGCDGMQQRFEPERRKTSDDTRASAPATAPPTTNSAVASPPPGCGASRAKKTASPITAGRKMTRSGPQNRAALPGSAMSAQMLAKLSFPHIAYLLWM